MHHGTVLGDGNKKSVLPTLMGMTNSSVVFSRIDFNTDTTIASAALMHFGGRKTSFRYRILALEIETAVKVVKQLY